MADAGDTQSRNLYKILVQVRNEMPFGRDTRIVPSNIVLDRDRGHTTGRGDLVGTPVRSDAAKLLCPLLLSLLFFKPSVV